MAAPAEGVVLVEGDAGERRVVLQGRWSLYLAVPRYADIAPQLADAKRIVLAVNDLAAWDSSLLSFVAALLRDCASRKIDVDRQQLPDGLQRLLTLAFAVPPSSDSHGELPRPGYLEAVGLSSIKVWRDLLEMVDFAGEIVLSLQRFVRGKARFRRQDLWYLVADTGPRALPIVSLISFLVGTILAYMGANQLALFGAEIYIADLVSVGMVREVGALMTGIILAGRTGAAYAAQLGTMQVNEEIDAFRTLGVSPIDYLVLPRLIALVTMVPLLTLYSGVVGCLAGMVVATTVFHLGVYEYFNETVAALTMTHLLVGVAKGTVYGALVAYAGCLRGMQCGRSAQAVGESTTSAVVLGILLITVSASLLTIVFQKLGI